MNRTPIFFYLDPTFKAFWLFFFLVLPLSLSVLFNSRKRIQTEASHTYFILSLLKACLLFMLFLSELSLNPIEVRPRLSRLEQCPSKIYRTNKGSNKRIHVFWAFSESCRTSFRPLWLPFPGPEACISIKVRTIVYVNHNYIKILESDWSSTALISALIVQLHTSSLSN